MLRQRPDSVRNLVLALAVALVSGVLVDAGCSKGGEGKCGITCTGVSDGLPDLIQEQYNNMQDQCPILDSLIVERSSFPEQTLKSGWLPAEVPLNGSLRFEDCNFTTIADDAFQGDQFVGVLSLHLFGLDKLRSLRRDHFRSLKDLDTLEMRQLVNMEHVEDGLLADNTRLSTLQFSNGAKNSVAQFLANITGNDNQLPNLQTVDLGYNNLGRLEPQFFTSFAGSMLKQLYLNAANVTEIAPGTIPVTSSLVKLQLSENQMVTLKGDFYTGRNFSAGAYIYLNKNPWLCSCDLVWMINMTNIVDEPVCVFPGTTQNVCITNSTEEKICSDGSQTTDSTASTGSSSSVTSLPTTTEATTETATETTDSSHTTHSTASTDSSSSLTSLVPTVTTTTEVTTETTTETADGSQTTDSTASTDSSTSLTSPVPTTTTTSKVTTETTAETTTETTTETTMETTTITEMPPNGGYISEECAPSPSFSDEEDSSCGYEEDDPGTLIQMTECANGDKIHVRVSDSIGKVNLFVWSNTTQTYNGTCLRYDNASNVKSFYVTGLSASESFIICAVSTVEYGVNISNCGAHTMQPVVAQRPWLKNGEKDPYIIGVVVGVLVVMLVSGVITTLVIRKKPTLLGSNVEKVPFTDTKNNPRTTIMVTPRGYRSAADLPPEPRPRPPLDAAVTTQTRPSLVSGESTISYISVPTPRSSQLSTILRIGTSPRSSDASYVTIIESFWSDTVRSVRRLTGSISGDSSDTVYERRDSDIPYVQLGPDTFLPTTVVLGSHLGDQNKSFDTVVDISGRFATRSAKSRENFDVETASTLSNVDTIHHAFVSAKLHPVGPPPTDTHKKLSTSFRTNKSTLRALRKTHKAHDLVQKQLHMFDYVVFDETPEDDLPNETSDDCVPDVCPVVEDVRRELVLSSCGIPTTSPPGGRRDGVIFQPDADDEVSGCLTRSSELRRNLEDAIVLESLEKGGGGGVVQRGENPDVEERALFRPSGMWNQAPHTWSTTVPTIRLQKPSETDTDCDC